MLEAKIKKPELGYVGEITNVNVKPILDVLDKGYIPVVSTVGYDDAGNIYNINADTAAARIAGGLGAESLIAMTDIAGILKDKDDPSTLLSSIRVDELPELVSSGVIQGGMIPEGGMLPQRHRMGCEPRVHHRRPRSARHSDRNADK